MRPERAKRYNGAFFATNDLMQAFMTSTTLVAIAEIGERFLVEREQIFAFEKNFACGRLLEASDNMQQG